MDAALADQTIAVLGGTGPQGRGLARRFADAGLDVVIGSRDGERAAEIARSLGSDGSEALRVRGAANPEAAEAGDIVVVAVPWAGHADLLDAVRPRLAGKIVVDCVNPLGFDAQGAFALPVPEGSAAQQAQALLPESTVVGAFHNVSAVLLEDRSITSLETDVLVLGDVREATDRIQELVGVIPGARGVYGGRLRNAHQVEALTANLIAVNRRYQAHAGLRVTDI